MSPPLDRFDAALFDLDGVLTSTARQHFRAWKQTFDDVLARQPHGEGDTAPFELDDYHRDVDGRPRDDGVRGFLASRGISLDDRQVSSIGDRKNELVLRLIHDEGVERYEGSIQLVEHLRRTGLRTAVVSASRNCRAVLDAAGIGGLFDTVVDGEVASELGLPGKPAPDTFLEAARRLEVPPSAAIVLEDALAGVEAGRAGDFGLVVGVDRVGQRQALLDHGADVVVADLAELLDSRS